MARKKRNKAQSASTAARKRLPSVLLINGPNLNMLGKREPKLYGSASLSDLVKSCKDKAAKLGLTLEAWQSNYEGEMIDWIHEARETFDGIIINPGGYAHTSVALMDALTIAEIPVIEVHITNIHAREEFRHKSYVSRVADGVICGLGGEGYLLALEAISTMLKSKRRKV